MSQIYDEAHRFARDFANTTECLRLKAAQAKLKTDQNKYNKAQAYMAKQVAVQTRQMMGQSLSDEEIRAFNQETTDILADADIAEFLTAQMEFGKLFQDVLKIIDDAIGFDINLFGGGIK
ncbi:MAG: YlbF family regulator [Eubacteriaceae bacterium]|nr:YlbF family regulator [Eubacteriaceae bacterium]